MKKFLKSKLITLVMMVVLSLSMSSVVFAAETLAKGMYSIDVTSSAAMFKVVDAKLTVEDENMSAVITLSGTGYSKLYMGTKEEAAASDKDAINYVVDESGMYTYKIPVSALDTGINVAAFSDKNQTWYDRTLTFNSSTLVLIKEEPKAEEPKVEQPKAEQPKAEQPKVEETVKPAKEGETIPKTGDNNMLAISIIVLLACVGILVRDRKINKEA